MNSQNDSQTAAHTPLWERRSWLGTATLESVFELNEQLLTLMRTQYLAGEIHSPLMQEVGGLLAGLDGGTLRRAAASAVLLVDAGLADAGLWSDAIVGAINDRPPRYPIPFFTVDGAAAAMRLVMTQTWHLARSQPAAARLLLGVSPANLSVIGGCTLSRLIRVAESQIQCLRPRWENRPKIWRDLLRMAGQGDRDASELMRTRGLQLLAAEARPG